MYDEISEIYLQIFPLNQAFLDFIPAYLGPTGSKILDLGCGPGDYVGQLEQLGYRATGCDASAGMIQHAQTHHPGTFFHYAFAEIDQLNGPFDGIYCVGNSLSYLGDADLPHFLATSHHLLKPGGFFIIQVVNWDRLSPTRASDFPAIELQDGRTFHRQYTWINPHQVIFETELRHGEIRVARWEDQLAPKYSDKLQQALRTTGFGLAGQFGDYQKTRFDAQTSPATIVVAQK